MPTSLTVTTTFSPSTAERTDTASPGSLYLIALSTRLVIALTTWRRSHATIASGASSYDQELDAGDDRGRADAIDRFVHERVDRHRITDRRFLGLDQAEVEQVVDDAPEPLRLAHHPLGERAA